MNLLAIHISSFEKCMQIQVITAKILMAVFIEVEKIIFKFIWKHQMKQIGKTSSARITKLEATHSLTLK
jgi:hypothetical protein